MEAHASALGGIANSHQRCSDSAIPQPKLSFVSLIAATPPHTLSQLLFQLRCVGGKRKRLLARLSTGMISAALYEKISAQLFSVACMYVSFVVYNGGSVL